MQEMTEEFGEELIASVLPSYRVERKLGQGAFGAVFAIVDRNIPDKRRAAKIIILEARRSVEGGQVSAASERLARDWRHLVDNYERLRCPEIVAVHDFFRVDVEMGKKEARAYGVAVMDRHDANLGDYVLDNFPLAPERQRDLVERLAQVLRTLHEERNFLYEDLKPENLLVRERPDGTLALVVGDVGGLRGLSSTSSSGLGQVTLVWMAPEVVRGLRRPDVRSLVWSLGLLGFYVIEGRLPYDHAPWTERFEEIKAKGLDFMGGSGGGLGNLRAVLRRCCAFEPGERYADFGEVVAALDRRAAAEDTVTLPLIPPAAPPPLARAPSSPKEVPPSSPPVPTSSPMDLATPVGGGTAAKPPGTVFRDVEKLWCPEMVVIPAGSFWMGDLSGDGHDDEKPVHEVRISYSFAVGKYEVTQAEYKAVVGTNPSHFKGSRNPVEQVSWDEAKEFIRKLNAKTGKTYRLLSEAEWEYAARAGTKTDWSFGDDEGLLSDYAWFIGNSGKTTHPVGALKPNAFGLYDMHGNVWEWVEDCCRGHYKGAPTDGSAWTTGDCSLRVLRGGSWVDDPGYLRAANRGGYEPGFRSSSAGFRLARTL